MSTIQPAVLRQARQLYACLTLGPGSEWVAVALVRAGMELTESNLKWACVRAAERDVARGVRSIGVALPKSRQQRR